MSFVQTVVGKIHPSEMGITYGHDHILFMPPAPYSASDPTLRLDNVEKSKKEIEFFRIAGGGCVVDMGTVEMGRNPEGLREISKDTGVNIISATGFNKGKFCEQVVKNKTVLQITERMIADLRAGMDDTEIKAGVIKASSSKDLITVQEKKVFEAAVQAHKETGATISTHTELGTMALEQINLLKKAGVKPESIVIGHVDHKLEKDYLFNIANEGVYLSFDQISKEKYYPDILRIEMIKELVKHGFGDQIMLAGDLARITYLPSYGFGYGPGYTYILWRFVPWMIEEGLSMKEIQKMLISNPALAFSWKK